MKVRELPLLFAIFIDLVGFGMAFPDIQTRAEGYFRAEGVQNPGALIGLLLSSYFVTQILVSPKWGSLSDRIGRKPVLLICTVLSALSMIAYALIPTWWGILFARLLAGFAAANVVVAQAYIADTTTEADRQQSMGRVSAAISLGLVAGPAIGGHLAEWGDLQGVGGHVTMGLVAAGASAMACLWIAFGVKHLPVTEVRKPGARKAIDLTLLKDLPALRVLFITSAIGWFALACLEGTFGRLIHAKLGYGPREFGWIFSYESLLGAFVAWFLIDGIRRRIKPAPLVRMGYFLQALGLGLTPFAPGLGALFIASTFYAFGAGVTNPTLNSLCSEATPESRQGEMFGLLQAFRSFGFMLGPLLGGILFDWKMEAPYLIAAIAAIVAAGMLGRGKVTS